MNDSWQEKIKKLEQEAKGTFWDDLGCRIERVEDNRVIVTLDVTDRHLNTIGILHGGVHATLLDNTMGIAAFLSRPGKKIVTTNLNLHYLSPLHKGTVTVTAEIVHQTNRTLTAQGRIEDEQGRLGSWGTGTFRVVGS